jgi:ATP-binding cassette subfamily A (ABC1) protein 3
MDKAITELVTGSSVNMPIPLEWPFTQETQKERDLNTRLAFVKSLKNIMVLGLVIGFLGIAYTLPGAFGAERASLLTAHLKAMGLRDSARIL